MRHHAHSRVSRDRLNFRVRAPDFSKVRRRGSSQAVQGQALEAGAYHGGVEQVSYEAYNFNFVIGIPGSYVVRLYK